jgi:amino acid adenylation domain-containing protein
MLYYNLKIELMRFWFNIFLQLRSEAKMITTDQNKKIREESTWKFRKINFTGIAAVNKDIKLLLSSTQKSIWATQKIYPNSPIFNIGGYAIYNIKVNEKIYTKAIEQIINEHDAFCLEFREEGETVFQQIRANSEYYILYNEQCKSEEEVLSFINNDMSIPFDFKGQLFKFVLFKVSDHKYYTFFKAHHLIFDGYSVSIFVKRLNELYENFSSNSSNSKETIRNSYVSLLNSESNYINSTKFEVDRQFWIELLKKDHDKAFESCAQLSNSSDYTTQRKSVMLKRDDFNQIFNFCKKNEVTVYHYFIASIYMLNRLYNNNLFVLGLPILNRSTSEHKKTIGAFISVIPFLPVKSEYNTFKELLSNIKSSLLSCYRHQKYPFYDLALEINKPGLFYNISFSYQKTEYPIEFAGEPTSTVYINNGFQQEDITIHLIENVYDEKENVIIYFDYKKDAFAEEIIDNLMNHFVLLLTNIYKNSDLNLNDIDFMPVKEKNQILNNFNNTKADFPNGKCIHQLFEEQSIKTPKNIAVVYNNKVLTYRELNRMSDKLASFLQMKNVKPNTLVGICMERSWEMVLAIVGVLKAGGAYVPLDPEYPDERLDYMIEDSKVSIILTQEHFYRKLANSKAEIVKLDTDWENVNKCSEKKLELKVTPENWAYMIYTSGSTGRPKGAINTHVGLVNRINWMQKELGLKENDAILQKTPFSFDVSVWEFVWPLTVGARIVMAKPGGHRDPLYLVDTICHQNITTIHFVPSMLKLFLDEITVKNCKSLKRIVCSGEELKVELQNECLKKLKVDLYNLYGPTEAAIDVSYWKCRQNDKLRVVPIGKPIDNIKLLILNKDLKILPVGVVGELYIAGIGLAVGYHNKPELTCEKFIPNPYNMQGYDRLYKTGDLARWLPDGNIEYLGRIDHQVKINGLRIELGEVEYQISCIKGIKEVKVVDKTDKKGNKFLAAYIVMDKQVPEYDNEYFRNYLRRFTPAFMIPSFFIYINKFPLLPNGKLDRRALPDYEQSIINNREYIEPFTKEEKELAAIFKPVLNIDKIGLTDNFFDLGGTSLKAIQVVNRYKAITIQELYDHPSIRTILQFLKHNEVRRNSLLTVIHKNPTSICNIICIPYGGGSPIIYQELSKFLSKSYSIYSVTLPGHDYNKSPNELKSVKETATLLLNEILNEIDGDIVFYGHCVGCALTYEIAKQLELRNINIKAIFMAATFPFFPRNIKGFISQMLVKYYYSNDTRTYAFLKQLGEFRENIDTATLKEVLVWFRHDGREAMDYFESLKSAGEIYKLDASIISITGDKDPLTKWFLSEVHQWEDLSDKVYYKVIRGGTHYFIHSHAGEVANIIQNILGQLNAVNEYVKINKLKLNA